MLKETIAEVSGQPVILMDSITKVDPDDAGAIVVSGSHGGASSGEFALAVPLTCVFFNDAGIGKDRAGIAALEMLAARDIAAAAVSHFTGRIGDAADMWEHGVISFANVPASDRGLRIGEPLKEAVRRFDRGVA